MSRTKSVECGELVKVGGKLCEIIGYADAKVVYFKVLKEEDKDKCPHCNKPLETQFDMVENCLNWKETVEPIKTVEIDKQNEKSISRPY